jgi:putative ABC transport system permease protein
LALLVAGGLVLGLSRGLVTGFGGLFMLILGCALLTPGGVIVLVRLNRRLSARFGLLPRMATRDVARHLSRTGVAVAALMVAFATTVGVGVMVDSFRGGVALWINDLVNADIYMAPIALETGAGTPDLHPEVIAAARAVPGVAALSTYRRVDVPVQGRLAQLLAVELAPQAKRGYHLIAGSPDIAWQAFEAGGAVIISEPLAYRYRLGVGDRLVLDTDQGPQAFPIAGVFLDYGSEHGRILIHRHTYDAHWNDRVVNSSAIYTEPGVDPNVVRQRLEPTVGPLQVLALRSNRHIQEYTLAVFDRTFTITRVLRLLAVAVAFVGVLSALMAMQLERAREFAILRAIGMIPAEIARLISLETGFMGFAAGLFAIPVGLLLAAVLIFVINRRAFGWTLPYQVDPWILVQAVVLALFAALLAGIYPSWRMAHSRPADALRTE